MSASVPKVSIGMPVYNGAEYLRSALDGLMAQTFEEFELIISDNASTDITAEICAEYAAGDARIKYVRNTDNLGGTANFNKVLELACGEYFMWASHDDLHEPDYLKHCVTALDNDASIVLCHCKTTFIDSEGVSINLDRHAGGELRDSAGNTLRLAAYVHADKLNSEHVQERLSDMLTKPYACVNSLGLMRTNAVKSTPGFQLYFGSDRVLLAELALMGRFHEIDEHLFSWRIHPQQATRQEGMARQRRMAPKKQKAARFKFITGYWHALWRVALPMNKRLWCLAVLARHYTIDRLERRRPSTRRSERAAAHG